MRLQRLVARGYRNLADLECEPPPSGVAILGANGQGKTNLLEAIYYPVLFRSFRGSPDQQVMREPPGFHVEVGLVGAAAKTVGTTYQSRKKRIAIDGEEIGRLSDAVGTWLAVVVPAGRSGPRLGTSPGAAAVPRSAALVGQPALSEGAPRYRAALAQRNSALRQGRTDLAQAFDAALAAPGAELVRSRLEWVAGAPSSSPPSSSAWASLAARASSTAAAANWPRRAHGRRR